MKITSLIILATISLCVSLCCPEDDDYNGNHYFIENNELLSVQNNITQLNVGDTLYFETNINTIQTTTTNDTIDLYDFSRPDESMRYHLFVYKPNSNDDLEPLTLNENTIIPITGPILVSEDPDNPYITVETILENDAFKNVFGVVVLETGTFYIGSYLDAPNGEINVIISNGIDDVHINTKIVNSNPQGLYQFTVN